MDSTRTALVSTRQVAPETAVVELSSPPGFDANPGQFVRLGVRTDEREIEGFYTISSADVADTFEVTVDAGPSNDLGRALAALEEGDEVDVAGPFGDAYYEGTGNAVVLASGPGIGAAIAICQRAIDEGHDAALVYRGERETAPSQVRDLEAAGVRAFFVEPGADPADLADAVAAALGETEGELYVYGYAGFVSDAKAAIRLADRDPSRASVSSFG